MSLYVFAVSTESDLPDTRLLNLIKGRARFSAIYCDPETKDICRHLSASLCIPLFTESELCSRGDGESDRAYTLRIKKCGHSLCEKSENSILFVSPEKAMRLCEFKKEPVPGFIQVL